MQLSKQALEHALQYAENQKNSHRPAITGVLIEPGRIVATDGHFLSEQKHEPESNDTIKAILEPASLKNALKVWPKKVGSLDVDLEQSQNGHIKFTDPAMPIINKIEGTYPHVDQVIPTTPNVAYRTYLSPELLETIGKTFKKLGGGPICLELQDNPMAPIIITKEDTKVVLMPANNQPPQPVGILNTTKQTV